MLVNISNQIVYASVDSMGAQLVSLRDVHGREYLWQGDPKYWKGQAPVLFPIVGALRDNKAVIDGETYILPRHGLARISSFRPVSSGSDRAAFRFAADAETRKAYPFDFVLDIEFQLTDNTLAEIFTVTNRGSRVMPFALGGHPGFNLPLEPEEESLADYVLEFALPETCDSPTLDPTTSLIQESKRRPVLENQRILPLRHELFYEDALILENLKSRRVSAYSRETGRGIGMEFGGFDYFGIWQPRAAPFLCLEPWTATATLDSESDVLSEKRDMILLEPGGSRQFILKISIL